MIKACIFDLDGTLANTLDSMAMIANEILIGMGYQPHPTENYKYYCGEGATVLMTRALREAGDKELKNLKEGDRLYREKFAEDPMYKVVHYEGMPETLKNLKDRGIKLAVCSNKPDPAARLVIKNMFDGLFDEVIGQSDRIKRKPDPEGPLYIAQQFGVKPEECMYIGDTKTDMQTGKAAGMYTVGALWGFRTKEELIENQADVITEMPKDLIAVLEEKNND